jgi:hypothetical protein
VLGKNSVQVLRWTGSVHGVDGEYNGCGRQGCWGERIGGRRTGRITE